MSHKWWIASLIAIIGGASSYYFGVGSNLVEKIIVGRYWLASKGVGIMIPNKAESKVIIGADGGTIFEKYGMKNAVIDPVYYDSIWNWGVKIPNHGLSCIIG